MIKFVCKAERHSWRQTHFGVCSECHHGKQSIGWTWRWRSDEPLEEDSR